VERHEIVELLGQLKLTGMRAAYDEVVAAGLRAEHSFQRIFGELLLAQLADHRARSTAYRMGVARFPVMKNLAEFDFAVSPVNQGLVRELHEGGFLATQRNAVLIGGTGTGKSHIAIAIGANCVRNGARVRFFTAVDLVNQLEAEARAGKAGKLADQLVESLSAPFRPEAYRDEFQERLNELIEAKLKGKTVAVAPKPGKAPVIDMMEALKRSLAAHGASPRKAAAGQKERSRRKAG